ncbi:arginine--tRNA ligase [Xanthobacter autotrophicus]|uniref:arginine--tRNA ligase n=1 Tax=Xanthobacter TaxID=279 RepID=UPI0024AA7E01|nr:arginine--tRNA ligase [Xanthobacter autotrophicus]MDI4662843.1 arginine--tRNA ligase [Xanthobacter autotrophicus]
MNVYAIFADHVREAVAALVAEGTISRDLDLAQVLARVVVEPPRDATHGDLATNAAMVLAKDAGMKPRDLAERIAGKLGAVMGVKKVDVAGPGFINIALDAAFWPAVLAAVLRQGLDFGRSALGAGEKVNVEYVSANPTGPMHVGHCRGAVFGDALARLMDFGGFAVIKEYYINDAGAQVDVLARSAFLRYREALGEDIGEIPEGLYPGDYLVPVGQKLAAAHGTALKAKPEAEWLPLVRGVAIDAMMVAIREDLAALGISFDVFFSERSLSTGAVDLVGAAIEALRASGEVYEGRLPPPKGAPIEDWEDREQTLFRSTDFGDDVDRPLKKSDGSYTYFAGDIAYHKDKVDRGFLRMIDVWGADHGGYVKRMQAAVKAVSGGKASLDVELIQLVRLFRAGEPVRMSKRSGSFVTLREVVDEVGRDAVRFMMLFRKNDAPLDFDLAKVIEQSRENPVFYVQYAHARAKSILRNAAEEFADMPQEAASFADAPLARLDDEGELALLRRLAGWPRLVEQAAGAREPHRIAFFLHDLAGEFHGQWNRGKDLPHLRFIIENDRELTSARLALVHGVATVLASGLKVLGVTAVDEMK